MISRRIVEFCSEEVGRQYANTNGLDACRAVPGMVRAFIDAKRTGIRSDVSPAITIANLLRWAHLIEPRRNKDYEFRQVGVRVGDHVCPPASEVPALMERYIELLPSMNAEEAYFAFQAIHPFTDGNGRVGKLIFNLKNNTMHRPVWPPNKWNILNP